MKNLPNQITIVRILLIPFIMFFYFANFFENGIGKLIALILFVIAALSDMLDGYIARKYNLVTDFGKFLDPIADKIMASTGLLIVVVDNIIPSPYGAILYVIMLLRDYIVTGLRQIGQIKGCIIAADFWAKIKSIFLDIAIVFGMVLAYLTNLPSVSSDFMNTFAIIFYVLSAISGLLIIISGFNYVIRNRHVFKEESKTGIVIEKDDSEDILA